MKYLYHLTYLLILASFLGIFSCDNDNDAMELDEKGLTKDITDLVPQEILDEMIENGMPIYGGANPPNIEGRFYASPMILLGSNIFGDFPGKQFADYELNFTEQNDNDLSIMVDYVNANVTGTGIGSFIVGEDCQFSVFVEIIATKSNGFAAQTVQVVSGCLTESGLSDLITAIFMIDDRGAPAGEFIEIGEGRVLQDEDGISENI